MKKNALVNAPLKKNHVSFLESLNQNYVNVCAHIRRHATFQSFLTRQFVTVIAGSNFAKNHKSRTLTTATVNALRIQSVHHITFSITNASVNVAVMKNVPQNIILTIILVSVNAEELTVVVRISTLIRVVVNAGAKASFPAPVGDIIAQRHAIVSVQINVIQTINISMTPVNVYLTHIQNANHF